MEWSKSFSKALEHVLTQDEYFETYEILEACRFALRKYGHEYSALGEAIVEIIHHNRFSLWTMLDCERKISKKRAANARKT